MPAKLNSAPDFLPLAFGSRAGGGSPLLYLFLLLATAKY